METDPVLAIVNETAYLAWSGANSAMGIPSTVEGAAENLTSMLPALTAQADNGTFPL